MVLNLCSLVAALLSSLPPGSDELSVEDMYRRASQEVDTLKERLGPLHNLIMLLYTKKNFFYTQLKDKLLLEKLEQVRR